MIPRIDFAKIVQRDKDAMDQLRLAIQEHGFLIVSNTVISPDTMRSVLKSYSEFFHLPDAEKHRVNMAKTGSNRGWGASRSEQVDPNANPDYKEVFDCGFEIPKTDPLSKLSVYAPNLWPEVPQDFRATISAYYDQAQGVALHILRAIAHVMGLDQEYFDDKFSKPMALLRGNFYPQRPTWAGEQDFGIAAHTDYGCVTLLGTDGVDGLEAQTMSGQWLPVRAEVGEFIINFGEMLQMWTDGQVRATPHRVRGTTQERISVPLFFNPNYDTNVAPIGAEQEILAGEHLEKRFKQTYLHLKGA